MQFLKHVSEKNVYKFEKKLQFLYFFYAFQVYLMNLKKY